MNIKKNIVPAVGVVIFNSNRDSVLLVKHGKKAEHLTGVYGFPAGRFEKGEDAINVAIRELKEETGLIATKEGLIEYPNNNYAGSFKRKDGSTMTSTIEIFICKKYTGTIKATEETIPEWIKIKELEKYNLLPNIINATNDALKYTHTNEN